MCGRQQEINSQYPWLALWNDAGIMSWNKSYDLAFFPNSVSGDSDGIYVIGDYAYTGALYADLMLLRYDTSGNLIWQRNWNHQKSSSGLCVCKSGSDIFTQASLTYEDNSREIVITKWNAAGEMLWNMSWSGEGITSSSMWVYNSKLYVTYQEMGDLKLTKISNQGTIIWNKTYGSIYYIENGKSVWADNSGIYTAGLKNNKLLVIKWDESGNVIWTYSWDIKSYVTVSGIIGDSNSIYISGTCADTPDNSAYDPYAIKLLKGSIETSSSTSSSNSSTNTSNPSNNSSNTSISSSLSNTSSSSSSTNNGINDTDENNNIKSFEPIIMAISLVFGVIIIKKRKEYNS
jgi:hypothetical protein